MAEPTSNGLVVAHKGSLPSDPGNVTVTTMSGVGFGLSPATGHAIYDLVTQVACSFS